jgi:hypothetical protein
MTIDPFWRDAAALWGAALSTLLAIGGILSYRPRFHVEPSNQGGVDLTVRIVNPSKRMRFVKELWRFPPFGTPRRALGVYTDRTLEMGVAGEPGSLWLAIKGEDAVTVMVNCLVNPKTVGNARWLVIFGWQGSWVVSWFWLPIPVFLSTSRANRLNAAELAPR